MGPQSNNQASALSGQNLWLRLLILVLALFAALDASWRQLGMLMALYCLFMLLDLSLYPKLLRGLRLTLPFLAAYWVFGTIFKAEFPDMLLFSLKLIFFIEATVYCFGNLHLSLVLRDTSWLRKRKWGMRLLRFILATALYIRAYTRHFDRHKLKGHSSIGTVLDSMIAAATRVYRDSDVIEAHLAWLLKAPVAESGRPASNLIALSLMTLMVLISSV
ncbi:MAG: hypothetical protein BWX83_00938 [Candidatus Cloacimonetes bacterium ADurb.Bin117]|nr:MAG: hypothetical protein BWX83_00938 [Candidatus Cloacimonetes bacterium ADurb.Bin117]